MATTHVAFLRAVNVAGHARVRMDDVRAAFSAAGCQRVTTVIQSGNVLFAPPAGGARASLERIRGALDEAIGEEPQIMLRTVHALESLIARAPFKDVKAEPGIKLYVAFLARTPRRSPRFPLVLPKEALEAVGLHGRDVFIVSRRKKKRVLWISEQLHRRRARRAGNNEKLVDRYEDCRGRST